MGHFPLVKIAPDIVGETEVLAYDTGSLVAIDFYAVCFEAKALTIEVH